MSARFFNSEKRLTSSGKCEVYDKFREIFRDHLKIFRDIQEFSEIFRQIFSPELTNYYYSLLRQC